MNLLRKLFHSRSPVAAPVTPPGLPTSVLELISPVVRLHYYHLTEHTELLIQQVSQQMEQLPGEQRQAQVFALLMQAVPDQARAQAVTSEVLRVVNNLEQGVFQEKFAPGVWTPPPFAVRQVPSVYPDLSKLRFFPPSPTGWAPPPLPLS